MKKVLSLLLSMAMLISAVLCADISALAETASYPDISVGETKTVKIENAGGYYYFIFRPETDGNYVFRSDSDDDTYGYIYDEDMNELASDDDNGSGYNFLITYDFEAGKTYILGCGYWLAEYTGAYNVSLFENPVESISFTPANPYEIVENTNGGWDEYYYDDEYGNEQCEKYWRYYVPDYQNGDVLTVNNKDGSTAEYIYDYSDGFVSESGGRLDGDVCSYSNDQYSNHWTLGGENYLTFEYMGASVQVPVTITENPVASISYTPAKPYEIIENTRGSWEDEHWIYDTPYFQVGDVLTVNNKDGSTVSYTYAYADEEDYYDYFVSENGDKLDRDYLARSSDQYSKHWTLGSENYFIVEYMGVRTQVPVTITKNPVASISFKPAKPYEIVENTKGYLSEYYYEDEHGNEQCEEYWRYYIPDYQNGDELTVNNKDGSSAVYIYTSDYYNEYFVSKSGDKLDWDYLGSSSEQYSKHWTLGSDNYFNVEYMGVSTQVPVRILAGIWHRHSYTETVTEPTCTERGYTVHTCKCGYSYTDHYVNAKGHNFGNNSQNCLTCGAVNPNYVAPQPAQPTVPVSAVSEKAPKGAKKVNGEWIAKKQKNTKISKLSKAKKSFKANWEKVSGITGYQIQYSTSKKFTKKTTKSVTIKKNKTTKATIKKLKAKKKYYVRIRTYKNTKLDGKTVKVYSSWSKAKTVTTK